ncbi:putative transmembrane protein [Toxoplasma gondii RUB]|uniref:Transmembrane protein n=11 Tax=Toxoplasma gondii TaxID=5811 RepID=S7VWG7_TOXGG|nr:hypothetical protein TGGT1_305280 [Toxoplasma gondii GT1]KAF4644709.1 hypothetical protein TGRH88_017030 [Toxoplasma gondii]KFG28452.1 putative transmembrane protein [Toxoplasma gondii p89]KFG33275.1 putative transmembrane protein [Toxoplasma gondii GAB2-2007-GAL-DOM2]KFG45334.1 putative transmembrane protein [Toxoplasma gondii FOU]KFG59250.1 putative transmembrane protein [Toxoplasma gondii RUB]KFH02584.1 putative transmembrane protein [Toxoplasma gondii VAND]KFH07061.1 putative transmem
MIPHNLLVIRSYSRDLSVVRIDFSPTEIERLSNKMRERSSCESAGQFSTISHRQDNPRLRLWIFVVFVVTSTLVSGVSSSFASWASAATTRPLSGVVFPASVLLQHPVIRVGGGTTRAISQFQQPPATAIVGSQFQAGALSHPGNPATLTSTLLRGGDVNRPSVVLLPPNGQLQTSSNAPLYVLASPEPSNRARRPGLTPNQRSFYDNPPFYPKDLVTPQFEERLPNSQTVQAGDRIAKAGNTAQGHSSRKDPMLELHPDEEALRQRTTYDPSTLSQVQGNPVVITELGMPTVAGSLEKGFRIELGNTVTKETHLGAPTSRSAPWGAGNARMSEAKPTLASDTDGRYALYDRESFWSINGETSSSHLRENIASEPSFISDQTAIGPAQEVVCPIRFIVPQLCFSDLDCPIAEPDQEGIYTCSTISPRIEGVPGVCRLTCDGTPSFPCPIGQTCTVSMDVSVCVEFCPPDGNPPCDRVACSVLQFCTRNWCRTQGALLDPTLCVPPFDQHEEEFFCIA